MSFGPLISAQTLKGLVEPVVLLDARHQAWAAGHFAGALEASPETALSAASQPGFDPAVRGRHPLPSAEDWSRQLGAWGLTSTSRIVIYDGSFGALGGCRLWWMLRASGLTEVALLDGGIPAGQAAGLAWTTAPTPVQPTAPFPFTGWQRPVIDLETAAAWPHRPNHVLIDVRSPERWRGEVEPIDPVAGRIPGTRNLFFQNHLTADGCFRSAAELRQLYRDCLGPTPISAVAFSCGSGVSACHGLFALELAGLDGAALYEGSYSQWCRSGRPIGRG